MLLDSDDHIGKLWYTRPLFCFSLYAILVAMSRQKTLQQQIVNLLDYLEAFLYETFSLRMINLILTYKQLFSERFFEDNRPIDVKPRQELP